MVKIMKKKKVMVSDGNGGIKINSVNKGVTFFSKEQSN